MAVIERIGASDKLTREWKGKQEYFDAFETLSITDLVLADEAFYVGTNAGVVSKFTLPVSIKARKMCKTIFLLSKGQMKSKSRLASRRFSQKMNERI